MRLARMAYGIHCERRKNGAIGSGKRQEAQTRTAPIHHEATAQNAHFTAQVRPPFFAAGKQPLPRK